MSRQWFEVHKDKLLPNFCYSKAFWVLLPIMVASFSSVGGAIYAQVQTNVDDIQQLEITQATNNVPELKEYIDGRLDKQDDKIDLILLQQNTNYKLLCKLANGEC